MIKFSIFMDISIAISFFIRILLWTHSKKLVIMNCCLFIFLFSVLQILYYSHMIFLFDWILLFSQCHSVLNPNHQDQNHRWSYPLFVLLLIILSYILHRLDVSATSLIFSFSCLDINWFSLFLFVAMYTE